MTAVANHPTYEELLLRVQPHPITNEQEAERIRAEINALLDQEELSEDEWEFLALLGDVLSAWENERYQPAAVPVPEKIRALLEAHGLHQKDLVGPVFSTETVASDVLHSRRRLNYDHVERLAQFFHVSPAVFHSTGRSTESWASGR